MMAKPMKTLESHYPMIQFLIMGYVVDAIFVTMDLRAVSSHSLVLGDF